LYLLTFYLRTEGTQDSAVSFQLLMIKMAKSAAQLKQHKGLVNSAIFGEKDKLSLRIKSTPRVQIG